MSVAVTASKPRALPVRSAAVLPAAQRAPSLAIYMHDLSGGGVERQNLVIADEMRRRGVEVTLILHALRGELMSEIQPDLRIVDLKADRTRNDVTRLADFLRREKPDILLTNVDLNNIAALLAKALSMSPTKVVICQHNPILQPAMLEKRRIYRHLGLAYRLLSPFVSRAVAVSAGCAEELHRQGGIPRERIVTINNPVVGADFIQRASASVDHPWLGQDRSHTVFVTAGRLVPQKDHATLLRALALHRRRAGSRLLLLGTGPLESELRALTSELGLDDAVAFIGFRADAPAWFRQADAFVLSSQCEGFGNVLVEALGCGTPVITTDCPFGPRDILEDGRYGDLVPVGDPEALARAMDDAVTLRSRFPADMLRARADAFSYEVCADRYQALFEGLAPSRAWAARA